MSKNDSVLINGSEGLAIVKQNKDEALQILGKLNSLVSDKVRGVYLIQKKGGKKPFVQRITGKKLWIDRPITHFIYEKIQSSQDIEILDESGTATHLENKSDALYSFSAVDKSGERYPLLHINGLDAVQGKFLSLSINSRTKEITITLKKPDYAYTNAVSEEVIRIEEI